MTVNTKWYGIGQSKQFEKYREKIKGYSDSVETFMAQSDLSNRLCDKEMDINSLKEQCMFCLISLHLFFLSDFVFSPLTTVDIIRILWSKNNANLIFCAFNYFFKSFLNLKISKKL